MKKIIGLSCAIVVGSYSNIYAMHDDWYFRLSHRVCSWWHKKDKRPDEFPNVDALDEFGPLQDKDKKFYPKSDLQEFDKDGKFPIDLWTRCSKLAFIQNHWLPIFGKDRALLNFARTMAEHEKEWKSWNTDVMQTEDGQKTHYWSSEVVDKMGKTVKISQDYKSPYYKFGLFTESMRQHLKENRRVALQSINAQENTAYHDELKFLHTQLHKMELYWNMKQSSWSKFFQRHAYNSMRGTLKKEIEAFKTDQNRTAFTRSCMKKRDFRTIQSMRKAYAESQQKDRSEL